MAVIVTEALSKCYGPRRAVEQLSLQVDEGCIFGFIGPNGAGKTTTIRMLAGLLRPSGGRASVLGHDCWRQSPAVKRHLGYLPGDLRLPGWIHTNQALALHSLAHRRDVRSHGLALCRELDLDPKVRVRSMSRGMRQKLGLILAFAHRPRVLILDEPTSGLDPVTQELLEDWLRLRAREGTTVFFSSHVLSEVEGLCQRLGIVRDGRLVVDSSLERLREQAQREVIIRWNGGPPETPPPCLLLVPETIPRSDASEGGGAVWHCRLQGTVPALLRWLQGRPIADLIIGPPRLDTLFRSYYDGEEGIR